MFMLGAADDGRMEKAFSAGSATDAAPRPQARG